MKNIFLPKVTMCIIALLALILSASAQRNVEENHGFFWYFDYYG